MLERPPSAKPPAGKAERQRALHRAAVRRHRRRERDGVVVVNLALDPDETAKLVALRYLRECELEDRAALAGAVKAMIASIRIE